MSFTETLNERSKSQHYFIHIESAKHGAGLGAGRRGWEDTRDWAGLAGLHPQAGCAQTRLPSFVYALQILHEYAFVWCGYFIKKKSNKTIYYSTFCLLERDFFNLFGRTWNNSLLSWSYLLWGANSTESFVNKAWFFFSFCYPVLPWAQKCKATLFSALL